MVTIIKEKRPLNTGERFARAFQNLGEALPGALEDWEKSEKEKKLQLAKKSAKIRPGIKSFLSLYDRNKAFDADMISNLEEGSRKYIEQGFEPDEAISAAYNDILGAPASREASKEAFPQKTEGPSLFKGDPEFLKKLGIVSDQGFLSDVETGLKKGGRTLVNVLDFPLQLAKKSNYLGRGGFKTLTDYYDELTGGKGVPTNVVERVAQGIPLGFPGVAGAYTEEALHQAGLPESVQQAGNIISFIAAHRVKFPELKNVLVDAKAVSEKTGQSTEQVLQKAQVESGADLEKVVAGDEAEISKLRSKITETPKISEKVSAAPKEFFNKKAAEKQRAVFGAKLPESPLEEYYDIKAREFEKEAAKRPETLAREKEIRERLAPEETRLYSELRNQKEQLTNIEKEIKRASPENQERIRVLRDFQSKKVNETLEELKNVQYEMKYGRARPSEAEIDAQIQKSIKEFEEGILNPTEKTEKAIQRQLELDKKYLDRASKLIDRGELPGEIRPDTFLKMKQKYLEGYKAAIQKAKADIAELKGETDAVSLKKIADDQELVRRLSDRIKRLQADIVNQTDNIKAMRALEKPSGAFYKQQLKSLKKDAALFKDDLFKQKRIKAPGELKTGKVFKEQAAEIEKGRKLIEEPTKENIKEAAKEAGKNESEFSKALDQIKEEVKQTKEKVENGTVTPNTEAKFSKKLKGLASYIGGGAALGALQALSEEFFHIKPEAQLMRVFSRILGLGSLGSSSFGYKTVRDYFDGLQAEELIKLRGNISAWNQYINKMRSSYGESKVRRVQKIVRESELSQK
jgi:hypothetical protein